MKRFTTVGFMLLMTFIAISGFNTRAAGALDRRVVVINHTSETLITFQASNVSRNSWEEDILGADVLYPGQRITVDINDGSGYCRYDFRATFTGGGVVEKRNVNVCEVTSWTIYDE